MSQSNKDRLSKILNDYAALISAMPGHVYWKDRAGVYRGCNKAQSDYAKKHFHTDLIGKTLDQIIPASLANKIIEDDNYVMETGKEITIEEPLADGTMLSKKVPLKDEKGEIVGMLGISFDITEHKRRTKELERIQTQTQFTLDSIITNLPGHVFWLDKDGLIYLGCNKMQAQSMGLNDPSEVVGKSLYDLNPAPEAKKLYETNQTVLKEDKLITLVEEGMYANGQTATFISKKMPIKNSQGEVIGLLGIAFDITAEKEAEKLKEEKLVVEVSLKNAKLMAAGIAHELRTPLATINSIASNLEHYMKDIFIGYDIAVKEHKFDSHVDEEVLDYLKNAPKSLSKVTYTANTFINMMLMKVNLENVKRHELHKLSIAACINESIKLYPLEDEDKKLIKLDLTNDFKFMGDSTLFTHIIFNLLKNGLYYIKAARKGEITIWLETGHERNVLHFKDTGTGMSKDVLEHLFLAFYSKTRHGTGVGLALCKLIMQEFGGEMSCDSVQGEYTHFKMYFPMIKN